MKPRSVAITNAHVIPVIGEPFDGTIVITDGKITALGPEIVAPDSMDVVDAAGCWALPGFVEAHGHIGAQEESIGWAGSDINESTEAIGPRFRAVDAIHPTDQGFADALEGGVTTAVVKPGSANPIGGQTVAMKCWGAIIDDMVIKAPCSMKAALGENPKNYHGKMRNDRPATRLATAAMIREAFVAAQNYRAKRDAAQAEGKPFDRDLQHEALLDVLDRKIPWSQHVHRVDDIATAIRLADEFGYRLVINHGTEAHLIASHIAQRGLPVLLGPLFTSRSKWELANRTPKAAGILAKAGVELSIITDHPVVPINFLVYQAIVAVKEGLDPEVALRAITINPAKAMGIDDRVGSLEVGKDGDVVLWDGDPLEIMHRAQRVFIDGREVYYFDPEANLGVTLDPYAALAEEAAR